jgi:hypothetical protein
MKITLSVLFLFVVTAFAGFRANAQQKLICTVEDPTGTRLNVREYPGSGRIVGKLRNGTIVRLEFWTKDPSSAKAWGKISVYRGGRYVPLGYAFGEYINCD